MVLLNHVDFGFFEGFLVPYLPELRVLSLSAITSYNVGKLINRCSRTAAYYTEIEFWHRVTVNLSGGR